MFNSNLRTGIFGAIAFSLSFGAVQLASGHDLTSGLRSLSSDWDSGVNRAAKADRAAKIVAPAMPAHTYSVQPEGLANTLVVIRVPVVRRETGNADPAKRPVACEPVVSVLTEIAKRLQPGRCIT
jgi:hypothetical protein